MTPSSMMVALADLAYWWRGRYGYHRPIHLRLAAGQCVDPQDMPGGMLPRMRRAFPAISSLTSDHAMAIAPWAVKEAVDSERDFRRPALPPAPRHTGRSTRRSCLGPYRFTEPTR